MRRSSGWAATLVLAVSIHGCSPIEETGEEPADEVAQSPAELGRAREEEGAREGSKRAPDGDASGSLAVGDSHACAVTSQGRVKCWGYNRMGQLGNGTTEDAAAPVDVQNLSHVKTIAAGTGSYHTCALKTDGTVACWGLNACGQLGDGARSTCGPGVPYDTFSSIPVAVVGLTDAVEIAVGQYASCARRRNASVVCWGLNEYGGLGNGTVVDSGVPVAVLGLTDAVELTVGSGHACARKRSGGVVCWGFNIDGRLGNGTTDNASTPVPVPGLRHASAISAGNYHTCARGGAGSVLCWGSAQGLPSEGGARADALVPTHVPALGHAGLLAASAVQGACTTQHGGSVVCWRMPWNEIAAPELVTIPRAGHVSELHAGIAHACARRSDRSVVCWGRNNFGQLGGGTLGGTTLQPTRVVGF